MEPVCNNLVSPLTSGSNFSGFIDTFVPPSSPDFGDGGDFFESEPNQPPVAIDDFFETLEDIDLVFDPTLNDSDPDGDPIFVFDAELISGPAGGLEVSPDSIEVLLFPNQSGTVVIDVTIIDNSFLSDSSVATITVIPVNDAPVAEDDVVVIRFDGGPQFANVLSNDEDIDGPLLTITGLDGQPASSDLIATTESGLSFSVIGGLVQVDPGSIHCSIPAGMAVEETVSVTISDGEFEDTSDLTVVVTGPEVSPLANFAATSTFDFFQEPNFEGDFIFPTANDDSASLVAGGSVTLDVLDNDSTIQRGPLSVVALAGQAVQSGDMIDLAQGGRISLTETGEVTFDSSIDFDDLTPFETVEIGFSIGVSDGLLIDYSAATVTVSGSEQITVAGAGADVLTGGMENDAISGGSGGDMINAGGNTDVVVSGSGADSVDGGDGNDDLDTGSGGDIASGGNGDDTLSGGSGADVINGGAGDDTLIGGSGRDTLIGGAGDDELSGGSSQDDLSGGDGNDSLDGGAGADRLEGGAGDDVLSGGFAADVFVFGPGFGADIISDFQPGIDEIELNGISSVQLTDVLGSALQQDDMLLLDFGDANTIALAGVSGEDLSADDFILI